jgi:hypothetical protein
MHLIFKKISITFIIVIGVTLQSSAEDILFYYQTAVLAAIKSQKNIELIALDDPQPDQTQVGVLDIDVLANDTYGTGDINVTLENWDSHGQRIFAKFVERDDGNWSVLANNQVRFEPRLDWGGGSTGIQYQIEDGSDQNATAHIGINFPTYVRAIYDHKQAPAIEPVTVDVLDNDEIGAGITPIVQLIAYDNNSIPSYHQQVITNEGTWTVVDGNVSFEPDGNFNNRYARMNYSLDDGNGRRSITSIEIEFPVTLYAETDYFEPSVIAEERINVLTNDINASPVTVSVIDWTNSLPVPSKEVREGIWTVDGTDVIFTPKPSFGGGHVDVEYEIKNQNNETARAHVILVYPIIVGAIGDVITQSELPVDSSPVTIDVLANDTYVSTPITIDFIISYDQNGNPVFANSVDRNGGTFSVVNGKVVFTPGQYFGGGTVYLEYRITDANGYESYAFIRLEYPQMASPLCQAQTLITIADILDAIEAGMMKEENGWVEFEAAIHSGQEYVIPATLFTDTQTIAGSLNPMFDVKYEQKDWENSVRFNVMSLERYENDHNWSALSTTAENKDGIKSIRSEVHEGNYTDEADGSYLWMVGASPVFHYKPVQILDSTEIDAMFQNNGIVLALSASDTAQLNLSKNTENGFWWNHSVDTSASYNDLQAFITAKAYVDGQPWSSGLQHSRYSSVSITFAEVSSGNSGTLVEVSDQSGEILTANAGTWHIETITDNGETFDVIILKPILCGYDYNSLRRLDGQGYVLGGGIAEREGDIGAKIIFNYSLKEKLKDYFVQKALDDKGVDIDPDTPDYIEITDANITGAVFYDGYTEQDGSGCFGKNISGVPGGTANFTRDEMCYDAQGTLTSDDTMTFDYELIDGKIRIDTGSNFVWFILKVDTSTQWVLSNESDQGKDGTIDDSGSSTWYKSKPAGYPAEL